MGPKGGRVFVVGVGMTKFEKPGSRENFDYPDMAKEAAQAALHDAGISYSDVEQACVSYVFGDSTCGQKAIYHSLGLSGIPIHNVNNNCASGSSALYLAQQLIAGGMCDCVLALGFEKMERGSISSKFSDRVNPLVSHVSSLSALSPLSSSPIAAQFFAAAGCEHMNTYGTKPEHFAKIAWKNHKHSTNNPLSQFQDEFSVDDILHSRPVSDFLTLLQCCPTSDGSAAAVLVSESFVRLHALETRAVEIVAMVMQTDTANTFNSNSAMNLVGYDMTRRAAERAFSDCGLSPSDIQLIELHDCFSANELISYEALGLCPPGGAGELVDSGETTYGGRWVVNPSGGLISKGHPLGATGIAQCAEICWQLRGEAGTRQVPAAIHGLQHNLGLGGAVVVAVYGAGLTRSGTSGRVPVMVSVSGSSTPKEDNFKSAAVFRDIAKRLELEGESLVQKMSSVFEFRVRGTGDEIGVWTVDVKTGNGSVHYASGLPADVSLSVSDDDLVSVMSGKLNPQTAFFQGKMKIAGSMAAAMKLQSLVATLPKAKL